MSNCCFTACFSNKFYFIFNLSHMHMNTNIIFVSKFFCANDEIVCIIKDCTKTKPYFHTTIVCVMEFFKVIFLFIQLFLCCFLPYFWKTFTAVHCGFCKFCTNTCLCNPTNHTCHMLTAWFCDGCTSTFNLFQTAC